MSPHPAGRSPCLTPVGHSERSTRRSLRAASLLLIACGLASATGTGTRASEVTPGPASAAATPHAALVAEGEQWWTRSPDPGNPVACATCHHDPALTRGWAAGFPKVKPLPPPHTRVMTLLQANAEAVALHYRMADPRPAATAITAYLTALGMDLPLSPGISPGQPTFPERIRELAASVTRGRGIFARQCGECHRPSAMAASVRAFPRVRDGQAESLESFLEGHGSSRRPLAWDGQPMADVVAFLVSQLAGRPFVREAERGPKEQP